ncbi:hypothetical protein [Modestobacter sp. SYSU DS0657]
MSCRSLVTGLAGALAVSVAAAPPALAHETVEPVHAGGTISGEDTTWVADVPADWNGTLILYGHGYRPSFLPGNPAANAPDDETRRALLAEGYALVGSSYERSGWTLDTAAEDQLQTLEAFSRRFGGPSRVLAMGTSMGGLVTGQLAEDPNTPIDGALVTCGLVHGGVDLVNYQLDAAHAIAQLLVPEGADVRLAGFLADPGELDRSVATLTAAVQAGQATPEGRARIALAAALGHLPRWSEDQPVEPAPGDYVAQQEAQFAQLQELIGFAYPGRLDIERTLGGNASWNVGVDYRALLQHADEREQVTALYREAGLDLRADLDRLTATAAVTPETDALDAAHATSELTGELQVPVLTLHTTHDVLAAIQVQEEYAETVQRAGEHRLLRQAFVHRLGHCAFTPAELVASVHALDERVDAGRWTPSVQPHRLDAAAEELGIGESEILHRYRPAEWLGDRGGALGRPRF